MSLRDVVGLLACPHCHRPFQLVSDERSLRCTQGHAYDVARQGYVNLQGGQAPRNADTPAMVAARDRFLTAGHYRPTAQRLLELALGQGAVPRRLLEVGAGTGYYLAHLLDGLPESRALALDVSVAAARRAARTHSRLGSVVGDAWATLPVADGAVDVVLNVFAPRNPPEFKRVLAETGVLVSVTPQPEHLAEVRGPLGLLEIQPAKQEQVQAGLSTEFTLTQRHTLGYPVVLDSRALHDLVAMGPSAFHLSPAEIDERVGTLPSSLRVGVALDLTVWSPRN